MKKLMIFTVVVLLVSACKKNSQPTPKIDKVYWGNAIYNFGDIVRDYSTYQSYPDTIKAKACITLQPRTNNYMSYTDMVTGDTMDFLPVGDIVNYKFDYYYLYNINKSVKSIFISTTEAKIIPMHDDNSFLLKGTITLTMDNFIRLEYTDSVPGLGTNQYSVLYKKHTNN